MLMSKLCRVRSIVLLIPLLVVMFLLVASAPTQASAPAAPTLTFYSCTPSTVAAFTNRVHVLCTAPYNTTIYYFGYCTANDSATASRMLSIFTAAKALGKNVGLYFEPGDISGTACGCQSNDCRVVSGAEIRP